MTRPMQLTMPRLFGTVAAIVLALAASRGAQGASSPADAAEAALHEGNRLFRAGRIEAAVAAYLEGYSPQAPHPTVCYNLGTALHHLDRLPEAVLWYRRAARSGGAVEAFNWRPTGATSRLWQAQDPWLEENLWLARRGLGSQVLPPAGPQGWLAGHTGSMRSAAVAIAWITLLLVVARDKIPFRAVIAVAGLAISIYGGAAAVERWGPRPAVILQDCLSRAGQLPAGTEAWVRPDPGGWRVSGSAGRTCPPEAVELIR